MTIALSFYDFNSIKVRLKLKLDLDENEIKRFQFHKGTIKTFFMLSRIFVDCPDFNSIKVRLKRHERITLQRVFRHFNSIKVRLKQPDRQEFQREIGISIP